MAGERRRLGRRAFDCRGWAEGPARRGRAPGRMARGACCAGNSCRWSALMVNFFIDRPIFAWVIAIVIMLAGGLSILSLPIAQYPAIAPPLISISVTYPGASAETVQS